MKNKSKNLSIIFVLLISIIVCSLTGCRNISDDLSSNISDISSVTSTVEIDYLKIFNDKYISICEYEKEDLESLKRSKSLYEELLNSMNNSDDLIDETRKEEFEKLKNTVTTKIDLIDKKISDLTDDVSSDKPSSNINVESSQNQTSVESNDTVSDTPQKINNIYTINSFIFPAGVTPEVLCDETGKIYSLPYGTVRVQEGYLDSNYFSAWNWKNYWGKYKWVEREITNENGIIEKVQTWEYVYGGTSMSNGEMTEWSKYGSQYFNGPTRNGSYIGEEINFGVWVWLP